MTLAELDLTLSPDLSASVFVGVVASMIVNLLNQRK